MLHLFHGMFTFQSQKASVGTAHRQEPTAVPTARAAVIYLHQLLNTALPRTLEIYSSSTQERFVLLLI